MKIVLAFALLTALCRAHAASPDALDRVLDAAAKSDEWRRSGTLADRLGALRREALKHPAGGDKVSDRFVITELAGPVDLVRFCALARSVCGGGLDRRTWVEKQWLRDGGDRIKRGLEDSVELYPDDLPSNALGGLFGDDVKPHNADLKYDLPGAVRKFFAELRPVPDATRDRFSHRRLVLGLTGDADEETERARSRWTSAKPLHLIPVLAPEQAPAMPTAEAALKTAGLEVRALNGHEILIERIGSPGPEEAPAPSGKVAAAPKSPPHPLIPLRPPPEPKPPRAVVVPERFPKAVPVREDRSKRPIPKAVPVRE